MSANTGPTYVKPGYGYTSPAAARGRGPNSGNWRAVAPISETANAPDAEVLDLPTVGLAEAAPTGDNLVFVEQERTRDGADPRYPEFLAQFKDCSEDTYYKQVLPFVHKQRFVINTMADLNYFHRILHAPNHPNIWHAITNVSFPKMYWFSGVHHNRRVNPFMLFLEQLPAVEEVSFTFHTAGLTTSAYNERERMRIEQADLEKSKQLRVIRLQDFTRHYDFGRLFAVRKLRKVQLQCIDSEMVSFWVQNGDPMGLFRELVSWIKTGFQGKVGRDIAVDAKIVKPE